MREERAKHRFGGVWTEIKLDALNEYLSFYQKALKNLNFETWYIDAFAGTGDRHADVTSGGIFEGSPIANEEVILDGSARKALRIEPPFKRYWFAETNQKRAAVLKSLQREFASDITVYHGEANAGLRSLFTSAPWSHGHRAAAQRAVVFLDPYGMSVDWETLKILANTKRADVWYLFPRKAVVQQLAHDLSKVDNSKRAKLNTIFGCTDWEERFYQARPAQQDMFSQEVVSGKVRKVTADDIAAFARERFGSIFSFVSDPLPLLVEGRDYFELYCFSNNERATHLIKKGVKHVLGKYTPASRRM